MPGQTRKGDLISREMKIMDLREQIDRGEYEIDPRAVADAIVRRLLAERGQRAAAQDRESA
jgi:anti-sigma28 factor (negative regulator of flagellin synthesis)